MRKLVFAITAVVVLLVAVDRVTVFAAERLLAAKMQSAGDLQNRPTITIHGFPFLTQAIAGSYDRIDIHATGISRQGVTLSTLVVRVNNAKVPLSKAINRSVTTVPVSSLTAQAVVSYIDLTRGRAGLSVKPDGTLVDVIGSVKVLGQDFTAKATSTVTLQGQNLKVQAKTITVLGFHSSLVDSALTGLLDFTVPIPTLPYGLKLTGAHATDHGVVLTAATGATVLRPGPP